MEEEEEEEQRRIQENLVDGSHTIVYTRQGRRDRRDVASEALKMGPQGGKEVGQEL